MHENRRELEELNRYGFDENGREDRPPSKALKEAISNSRSHIEAAFRHAISSEDLGKLKVRVKIDG